MSLLTGSFLTADKFGDTVPESASVSPFDDITLPCSGLSDHHSPASQDYENINTSKQKRIDHILTQINTIHTKQRPKQL